MAVKSNQQLLIKIAQINKAVRHVLRNRSLQKKAGWFKKKYEKPGWENDEDAVNQFVKDKASWGPFKHFNVAPEAEAVYKNDIPKAHEAMNRFNAMLRVNRHSDRSAALLDRYFDLWGDDIEPTYKPLAYKGDRYDVLADIYNDLYDMAINDNAQGLPLEKQKDAEQLWKDIGAYLDDYTRAGTKNPSKDVYFDVSEEALKEPLTRKDVGSLEDATPKQIEKWKRDSKKSPLWSYLWPTLTGVGTGALIGSQVRDSRGDNGALALGLLGTSAGGLLGLLNGDRVSREKQYAERRLNEK